MSDPYLPFSTMLEPMGETWSRGTIEDGTVLRPYDAGMTHDANGYEEHALTFMRWRTDHVGKSVVREWARGFLPGASVLELGCGHGAISEVLMEAGLALSVVDASPTLLRAFSERFPAVETECAAVEGSNFFGRRFDGVVAWGLIFLLPEDAQRIVLGRAANALKPGGRFLFTAPRQACVWMDALTRRESRSLGVEVYGVLLQELELHVDSGRTDDGENHYYFVSKPADGDQLL